MNWPPAAVEWRRTAANSIFIASSLLYFSTILVGLYFLLPAWIFYGAPIAATMYFFDNLPLQHYWNPGVRELYPHRQWKLERLAMQLLHGRPRILPASRLTSCSGRIPSELWKMILDDAIDVPFYFDTACEPKYFFQFIRAQTVSVPGWEYTRSEQDRKKLRLVCRLWAALLSERTMRWVASKEDWNPSGTGLLRAHLPVDGTDFELVDYEAVASLIAASTSQTRALTSLTMNGYRRISTEAMYSFMQRCQNGQLDRIQSFMLDGGYVVEIPASFIQEINSSFSNLRYLRLEGAIAHGGAVFEKLDILYLNVPLSNPEAWFLPSLRHLALGDRYLGTSPFTVESIPGKPQRLLSLLLLHRDAVVIKLDSSFWNTFSSLVFFGVRFKYLRLIDTPPPGHPLSHLFFTESRHRWNFSPSKIDIMACWGILQRLPSLRFVTLPSPKLDIREESYSEEWKSSFCACQRAGVAWLDDDGHMVDALARPAVRVKRWWEIYAVGGILLDGVLTFIAWFVSPSYLSTFSIPGCIGGIAYPLWVYYETHVA